MSALVGARGFAEQGEREQRRDYEGLDRVPLLPLARWIAVVPGTSSEEPAAAFIGWNPGVIEHPYPGTALWRAALERYLVSPQQRTAAEANVRGVVRECLERFPTLTSWLRWAEREREVRWSERSDGRRRRSRLSSLSVLWPW